MTTRLESTTRTSECLRSAGPGLRIFIEEGFEERCRRAGLTSGEGFDALMASARRVPGGRSEHRILDSATPPIRLRAYEHGGLLAPILGGRFLSPNRPMRELRLWRALRDRGIPMPTPVLASGRRHGLFWRLVFGSLDRGDAKDGAEWLAQEPSDADLREACVAFARALRRLHDAGGMHGDLHPRNVLFEEFGEQGTLRCMLIDLDRGRLYPRISSRRRVRELLRFARSLEKTGRRDLLSRRHRALVLSAYCESDRALRRSMLRWARFEAIDLDRHRVAWRMARRRSGVSAARPR